MIEKKPWYKRDDLWVAVGTVVSILLMEFTGVELPVEAFVTIAFVVVGLIIGTTVQEVRAMAMKRDIFMMTQEKELRKMELEAGAFYGVSREDRIGKSVDGQ